MTFGEKLRYSVYWGLDALRGCRVKKHYDDIAVCMQKLDADLLAVREKEILDYARVHVPFYRGFSTDIGLSDFPVMSKKELLDHYEELQSDEYPLRGRTKQKVYVQRTSGSTGEPLAVRQDRNKRERCYAEMMYFWGRAGYRIGEKYIYYRVWNRHNRKNLLSAFARNITMRNIIVLGEEALEKETEYLLSHRDVHMLMGYASSLENLGNWLYSRGYRPGSFQIRSVIAISEALSENGRVRLQTVFGCPVISYYSNTENGAIGQWDDEAGGFRANMASMRIEILEADSDKAVPEGEPGRVVITDFYSRAMPLIRYDTGDIARMHLNEKGQLIITSIEGRKIDFLYDCRGRKLSPHTVSVLFWNYPQIWQYQFEQTGPVSYILRIAAKESFSRNELLYRLHNLLGEEADIKILETDRIQTSWSGKRSYILNSWKKEEQL